MIELAFLVEGMRREIIVIGVLNNMGQEVFQD